MFEEYQRIRVINLAERIDRRREMLAEFARVGLSGDPRIGFIDAIKSGTAAPWRSKGERGCFLSHLSALEEAADAGESVLILEDDCDFTRYATAKRTESDLLWGGYTILPDQIVGAHCMGFSAETAKRCSTYLKALLNHPDPPPVDGAYAWFCRDNADIRVNACDPMIAVQRPSFSVISGRRGLDRLVGARLLVTMFRRTKRLLKRRQTAGGAFEPLRARLKADA
jgi:glycosyl transferase family 25